MECLGKNNLKYAYDTSVTNLTGLFALRFEIINWGKMLAHIIMTQLS